MVPLTSYFVDQSNQCNGSSELQRFNPKNWVVFTHSFLQCAIDLTDKTGKTALIHACGEGKSQLSKFLIEKGADINPLDCVGGNALLHAVKYAADKSINENSQYHNDNFQLIELLLEKGARADVMTDNEETAQRVLLANATFFTVSSMI